MLHIVLLEPEIPQNAGNVVRTAAATGSVLHLVEPLGFSLDEKHLKRAGLDYWDKARIVVHKSVTAFFSSIEGGRVFFFPRKAIDGTTKFPTKTGTTSSSARSPSGSTKPS